MRRRVSLALVLLSLSVVCAPFGTYADDAAEVKQGVDDIQADINEAIDRGVLWLLQQQYADGGWGQDSYRYPAGMTGLALYTLLKSGVPADHPCVALGFENLLSVDPHETYVLASHLMALSATGQPAHHSRMRALAERLATLEVHGNWSYPMAHEGRGFADRPGTPDLSNTQFAVLGLYAAHRVGIPVPRKLLLGILKQTKLHQQTPREVEGASSRAAGYTYRAPDEYGPGKATGSMTCAGITVLELCRRMLGSKLGGRHRMQVSDAIEHALAWLDAHWSVEENPGKKKSHKLYYLYGLERVGSLLGVEAIGDHAWYSEGARELLKLQKKGGEWGNQAETSFALLFLLRATKKAAVTGAEGARSALPKYASKEDSPIRLRARGHSPLTVWVASIHPDAKASQGRNGHAKVTRVTYVVDGEPQVTVAMGPPPHGTDATHRAVLHLPRAGKHTIVAQAELDGPRGKAVIESAPLEVEVKLLVQPWAWYEASWWRRDLRTRGQITATASSQNNAHQGPGKASDRHTEGYWVCQPKEPRDPRPTLHLEIRKGIKANAIVLAPVVRRDTGRKRWDRPKLFEVIVNGKAAPLAAKAAPDEMQSTVVRLPKVTRIKRLAIAVVDRTPGSSWPGETGFREVALEIEQVLPPTHEIGDDGLVHLACPTPACEIRYTLDGSIPTKDSPIYEGPFAWPGPTRLHTHARLPTGESSRLLIATLP